MNPGKISTLNFNSSKFEGHAPVRSVQSEKRPPRLSSLDPKVDIKCSQHFGVTYFASPASFTRVSQLTPRRASISLSSPTLHQRTFLLHSQGKAVRRNSSEPVSSRKRRKSYRLSRRERDGMTSESRGMHVRPTMQVANCS